MIPASFPPKEEIARLTARALLEIKAVHFNAETPFTLASGLASPTYIDCRKLISYPRIRSVLMDFLCVTVLRDAGFEAFDNIAGGETAGIPFAALVAERLALPMTYVRKKPKGYGRNARIEGAMTEGQRVLLVEDLTTDGGSKLSFVDAIRETGASCGHTAVIFYYGIFPETTEAAGSAWRGAASPLHLVGRAGRGAGLGCFRCADPGRGRGLSDRSPRMAGGAGKGLTLRQGEFPCGQTTDNSDSSESGWPYLVAHPATATFPGSAVAGFRLSLVPYRPCPQTYQSCQPAPGFAIG